MVDIFEEIRRLRKEMDRFFERFGEFREFERPEFKEPLLDLTETDNELVARIELPGVEKKGIVLNLTEDSLEIKAEKKKEERIEKEGYIKSERSYKGFYRKMTLPAKIIPEKAEATYKEGILEIRMPKAEKKKVEKVRRIEVK
jgi:HSP20 family protein